MLNFAVTFFNFVFRAFQDSRRRHTSQPRHHYSATRPLERVDGRGYHLRKSRDPQELSARTAHTARSESSAQLPLIFLLCELNASRWRWGRGTFPVVSGSAGRQSCRAGMNRNGCDCCQGSGSGRALTREPSLRSLRFRARTGIPSKHPI